MGADHRDLMSITFSEEERARCVDLVDQVFSLFAEWTEELRRYGLAHPVSKRVAPGRLASKAVTIPRERPSLRQAEPTA